jgi:hypothetical protein
MQVFGDRFSWKQGMPSAEMFGKSQLALFLPDIKLTALIGILLG